MVGASGKCASKGGEQSNLHRLSAFFFFLLRERQKQTSAHVTTTGRKDACAWNVLDFLESSTILSLGF
jgi:hypothetical protein